MDPLLAGIIVAAASMFIFMGLWIVFDIAWACYAVVKVLMRVGSSRRPAPQG